MKSRSDLRSLFMALAMVASISAAAQDIVIGHVAGYTGPTTKDATEMGEGAQVLFDAVNARGGVLGKRVRLLAVDDHFAPEQTSSLIMSLDGKVSALLPTVGSAQFERVLKDRVFDRVNLPLVGTIPATESFRYPLNRNIFHFRAGDGDQVEKIIKLLTSIGWTKIALLATDNTNGAQVAAFMNEVLARQQLKPATIQKYSISPKIDFRPAIDAFQLAGADAVILVGPPFATAQFVRDAKAGGLGCALYGMSYTDYKLVAKVAGAEAARGVAIAQVLPSPTRRVVPLVKEFHENFQRYGRSAAEPSFFNLEGYIAAKVIVEAIRKSNDASPDGVRRGLEQLRAFDLGGYYVDFSPSKHTGSNWVDMSMIGANGKLVF
jgi:ABC-type branched-subunit amino acid transport system substrate-binding protein